MVYLVGAGPGDSGLITQKGLECIKKADVIIYDHLANPTLLSYAKNDCKLIYAGKIAGNHHMVQEEINRIKEFTGKIVGYDIDARMLNAARINIEAAEMEDVIEVKKQNFFESEKDMFPLLMVFNPPYDERITINDPDFYKKIGDTFKQKYPNTLAWMISSDLEGVKNVGLRPSRKIKLFNCINTKS